MEPTGAEAAGRRPKRGRPADPELGKRRRQEIVAAAYDFFLEQGFHATSLVDVAKRAGVGKGTVYTYVQSKRELLDLVIDYGVDRLTTTLFAESSFEHARTLEEFETQLRDVVWRVVRIIEAEPLLVRFIAVEAMAVDEATLQRIIVSSKAFTGFATSVLEGGIQRGFLAADLDVEVTANALTTILAPGLLMMLRGTSTLKEQRRYIDGLTMFVIAGMGAR